MLETLNMVLLSSKLGHGVNNLPLFDDDKTLLKMQNASDMF